MIEKESRFQKIHDNVHCKMIIIEYTKLMIVRNIIKRNRRLSLVSKNLKINLIDAV